MNCIYLDNNATTPLDPRVYAGVEPYCKEFFGNPASSHDYGYKAAAAILKARKRIADLPINKIHHNFYRQAYALYHLGRLDESMALLEKILKEKERGPYVFKIGFLQGKIAAFKKDYSKVMAVYSNLKILNSRTAKMNWSREVQILTQWSSAYVDIDGDDEASKKLLLRGYGSANQAKDTNVLGVEDQEAALDAVEKGWYLSILYGFKLDKVEKAKGMKAEFFKKFPRSTYARLVRKLK